MANIPTVLTTDAHVQSEYSHLGKCKHALMHAHDTTYCRGLEFVVDVIHWCTLAYCRGLEFVVDVIHWCTLAPTKWLT